MKGKGEIMEKRKMDARAADTPKQVVKPGACQDCGRKLKVGQLALWGGCPSCENARLSRP